MTDDNAFQSYGWLRTVKETYTEDVNPKYALVQESKKLVGLPYTMS